MPNSYSERTSSDSEQPSSDSERSCERQRVVPQKSPAHLPRLASEHYRGRAAVHWTLPINDRATGWLTPSFHQAWQLALLHTCARYNLASPCYVLMPDHVHLLFLGLHADSDQRTAVTFLRKNLRSALAPHDWQKQAHDHMLRDTECERGAFQTIANYILENPVRAGLGEHAAAYAYSGCCVPGYPELALHAEDYWARFWRLHNYLIAKCTS